MRGGGDIFDLTADSPVNINQTDSVTISYWLVSNARMTVTIYDEQNNLIKNLKTEELFQAHPFITHKWGLDDTNGNPVSAGTYTINVHADYTLGGDDTEQTQVVVTSDPVESLSLQSPNGGENWIIGTSYPITWTSDNFSGDIKIEYRSNSGQSWTTITASTSNDGSYNWTVPDTPSANCLVKIGESCANILAQPALSCSMVSKGFKGGRAFGSTGLRKS